MSSNKHKEVSDYVKSISKEQLFKIAPPKTLATKGTFKGQFDCACMYCGDKTTFRTYTTGYSRFCSSACSTQHVSDNESESDRFKRMEKGRQTIQKKYKSKSGDALQIKLGKFYNPWSRKEVQIKNRETCLRLYGHPTGFTKESCERQVAAWRKSISLDPYLYSIRHYKIKTIVIQDKEFKVHGYEEHVLHYLIRHGVNANKIEMYSKTFNYNEHGKKRTYIPDIKAKIRGKWYFIEVKSDYTAGITHDKYKTYFYNLKRKSKAVHESGYRIITILYCHKRKKFVLFKNIHNLKRKDVIAKFNQ